MIIFFIKGGQNAAHKRKSSERDNKLLAVVKIRCYGHGNQEEWLVLLLLQIEKKHVPQERRRIAGEQAQRLNNTLLPNNP